MKPITKEDIFNFHNNLMTISFDRLKGWENIEEKEREYIAYWLKSKGVEVEK